MTRNTSKIPRTRSIIKTLYVTSNLTLYVTYIYIYDTWYMHSSILEWFAKTAINLIVKCHNWNCLFREIRIPYIWQYSSIVYWIVGFPLLDRTGTLVHTVTSWEEQLQNIISRHKRPIARSNSHKTMPVWHDNRDGRKTAQKAFYGNACPCPACTVSTTVN